MVHTAASKINSSSQPLRRKSLEANVRANKIAAPIKIAYQRIGHLTMSIATGSNARIFIILFLLSYVLVPLVNALFNSIYTLLLSMSLVQRSLHICAASKPIELALRLIAATSLILEIFRP